MTDQKQRLSDAEIIATFMVDPKKPGYFGGWWVAVPAMVEESCLTISGLYATARVMIAPREFTLDALHEVEARLKRVAPAQWEHYITRTIRAIGILADDLIHASAEQKTKALAEVLRPVVEKESTLRTPEDK